MSVKHTCAHTCTYITASMYLCIPCTNITARCTHELQKIVPPSVRAYTHTWAARVHIHVFKHTCLHAHVYKTCTNRGVHRIRRLDRLAQEQVNLDELIRSDRNQICNRSATDLHQICLGNISTNRSANRFASRSVNRSDCNWLNLVATDCNWLNLVATDWILLQLIETDWILLQQIEYDWN